MSDETLKDVTCFFVQKQYLSLYVAFKYSFTFNNERDFY